MTSVDVREDRYFKNEYQDYSIENSIPYITDDTINLDFRKFLIKKVTELSTVLENSSNILSSNDISIYTGLSGIAYFYFNLSNCNVPELKNISKKSRITCVKLIERSLPQLRGKPGSFICDDTGPMTMAVLVNIDSSKLNDIVNMAEYIDNNEQLPSEMLYGRCGYLFALLLLNRHGKAVSKDLIKRIFKSVVKHGIDGSSRKRKEIKGIPPLFYEWHDKPYLGAAHGMSGIMFMLLQVYHDPSLRDIQADLKNDIFDCVLPTIRYLAKTRLPSGNYPSSLGDSAQRDVLVHWCHGAPGWVHMFMIAYKIFKEPEFLDRVIEITDVIWNRGLLLKGCGICHGSAGNGYAFLSAYEYTDDPKYLYRALKFAEWCTDCFKNKTREADRPYSLFEGLAGTVNFLLDCLDPKNAKFPAYEL